MQSLKSLKTYKIIENSNIENIQKTYILSKKTLINEITVKKQTVIFIFKSIALTYAITIKQYILSKTIQREIGFKVKYSSISFSSK